MDTEPVCSGKDVKPECVAYRGGEILLKNGKVISPAEFPVLNDYIGQELVVTEATLCWARTTRRAWRKL